MTDERVTRIKSNLEAEAMRAKELGMHQITDDALWLLSQLAKMTDDRDVWKSVADLQRVRADTLEDQANSEWRRRRAMEAERDSAVAEVTRLTARFADLDSELITLRARDNRRWRLAEEAREILGTDDPEQAIARLREMALRLAATGGDS